MVHNIFKGLGIALITPFKEDGSVDYEALIRLVDYQLSNGADFFCILATTGETPVLTPAEKLKIKDTIVDYVQGRVPILMGCCHWWCFLRNRQCFRQYLIKCYYMGSSRRP